MTSPNLLRLVRSCAKWRSGRLLVATLFPLLVVGTSVSGKDRLSGGAPGVATSDSLPDVPGPVVWGADGVVAAGDTLPYTISWGPGARATGYDVTYSVVATNGTWTAVDSNGGGKTLPGPLPYSWTSAYTVQKAWFSAIPWDSATFTVSVASRNAVGLSAAVRTTWRVFRKPGVPGPIVIDSSLIPVATLVLPGVDTIAVGKTRVVCAFQQFGNGAVAEWTADRASCDSIYVKYVPASQRSVSVAQQQHTDSLLITCVAWNTADTTIGLTPLAPCSSAVWVTGRVVTQ